MIRRAVQFPSITASAIATGSLEATCRLPIESVERFSGHIEKVRAEFDDAGRGQEAFLICQTEAEVRRLGEVFAGTQLALDGRLHFSVGTLQSGFRLVPDRIVVLSSGELFRRAWVDGARDVQRPASRRPVGQPVPWVRVGGGWAGRSIASSTSTKATSSCISATASPATAA